LEYPFHDRTITVTNCGRICVGRRKINLSTVFAGQNVGIKEVSDKIWLVSFMKYDLGFFDHQTGTVTSAENPFGAKVTYVLGINRYRCARNGPRGNGGQGDSSIDRIRFSCDSHFIFSTFFVVPKMSPAAENALN
jgi:putative transposase